MAYAIRLQREMSERKKMKRVIIVRFVSSFTRQIGIIDDYRRQSVYLFKSSIICIWNQLSLVGK